MSIIGLDFLTYFKTEKSETIYNVDVSAEVHFHFCSGVDFYTSDILSLFCKRL